MNDLRYCIVSEYGSSNNRPHYHALFFVTIPKLTPLEFIRFVQRAWNFKKRGTTDTRAHKTYGQCTAAEKALIRSGREFVANGRLRSGNITSIIDSSEVSSTSYRNLLVDGSLKAINYVSKYISKEQPREKEIESIISAHYLKEHQSEQDRNDLSEYLSKYEYKARHWQSAGLGDYILDLNPDHLKLMEDNSLPVHSSKGIIHKSVPSYIRNKLFYRYEKVLDSQGSPVLTASGRVRRTKVLSDFGREFLLSHLEDRISDKVQTYKNFLYNPYLYEDSASAISDARTEDWFNEFYRNIGFREEKTIPQYDFFGESIIGYKKEIVTSHFSSEQLDSRLRELAIYELFYRNRYFQKNYYINNVIQERALPDYREMFLSSFNKNVHIADNHKLLKLSVDGKRYEYLFFRPDYRNTKRSPGHGTIIINDSCYRDRFYHFDSALKDIEKLSAELNKFKETAQKDRLALKERYRVIREKMTG